MVVGKIAYAGVFLGNIDEKFIYSRATIAKELLRRRSTSNPQLCMSCQKYNIILCHGYVPLRINLDITQKQKGFKK